MLTDTDIHYIVGLLSLISQPDNVAVELGGRVFDSAAEENRDVDVTITFKDLLRGGSGLYQIESEYFFRGRRIEA